MKQIEISFTNKSTGTTRTEIWQEVKPNIFQSPDGYQYTKGIIGWFCINPNK
jgi:hypothetical protein